MIGLDLRGFVTWLQSLGPFGLLAIFVAALQLRWLYWGWQYEELKRDRDEWKLLAQTGVGTAERATSAATEVVTRRKAMR